MATRIDPAELQRRVVAALEADVRSGAELAALARVSQPTISRTLSRLGPRVVRIGSRRGARYALARNIEGVVAPVSLYAVDESGASRRIGRLHPIEPGGFVFEGDGVRSSVHDDLPWFVQELRPRGYLGRQLPARHPELALPPDVQRWTSTHCLRYLARYGWDHVGNLIVGDEAFSRYLEIASGEPQLIGRGQRRRAYPRLARASLELGVPGSSAAGEQPKFLTRTGDPPRPVLVKFSPPLGDAIGRRVGDLLIAENVALAKLRRAGVPAAESELVFADDRVFLEVVRFDRVGALGRRGLVSLETLDAEHVGEMRRWSKTTAALLDARVIASADHLVTVRKAELYGELIGNTDMNLGNFSFFLDGTRVLGPAPVYDMGPALFAPVNNQLVERELVPPQPEPRDGPYWRQVWSAACSFWREVAEHPAVSARFRAIAKKCAVRLDELEPLGRLLPRA